VDDFTPDFLLGNSDLVEPAAAWCIWLDNIELGILLLAQPWIAAGGLRRADLERQLQRLGGDMPIGPIYFQRVSRAVRSLEERDQVQGQGSGRGRRFTVTPQGFAATQAPGFEVAPLRPDPAAPFAVESNLFKYHAACYMTHSAIEAVGSLRDTHGIGLDDLAAMTVYGRGSVFQVCNIAAPRTGLQVKFSIRHLAALALDGADTADLDLYTDVTATDPRIVTAREKVHFEPKEFANRSAAAVTLETRDGRSFMAEMDVGIPAADPAAQWDRLSAKVRSIADPVIGAERVGAMIAAIDGLDAAGEIKGLMRLLA
jgi:2-methylcitrate dehydratase PrpD